MTSALRLFKNRGQNIECNFGCEVHSAVLLKPNVDNILLLKFCEQKFFQHCPITIAIDFNCLSWLIFEENWPNYVSGPKSAPNSDSFWVRRLFNACVRVFCYFNCPIWSEALSVGTTRRILSSVYRLSAIRRVSGFRAVSDDAVLVLPLPIPIPLHQTLS